MSHDDKRGRVDLERVKAWFYSKPRKRAEHAFTAGAERQVAYMLEDASEGVVSARVALTNRERGRLDRLKARCDVLRARLADGLSGKQDWEQELSALSWAVERIERESYVGGQG